MIAHLRGKLLSKKADRVILEAAGVGYEVFIPVSTFYELGEVGADISLHIYTHVREDVFALYGFRTEREKRMFERLMTVSGVGPRLAVTILSGLELEDLIPAIRKSDIATLTRIPGVGRKTAERLALELREKLDELSLPAEGEARPAVPGVTLGGAEQEVLSALVNLGYAQPAAETAVRAVRRENPDGAFEHLLRGSLRLLARKFFPAAGGRH